MAKTIEITEPMRKALAEFGPDSAVFRLRGQIPKNYKDTHNGIPFVLVGGGNGTCLTHWYGPKVLAALQAEQASTTAR